MTSPPKSPRSPAPSPQFGHETPGGMRLLSAVFDRRWLRWIVIGLVLVVVALGVYYKAVVRPTLTATLFEVSVAGDARPVIVGVDADAGVVTVSGGNDGMSELVIVGDSLYALAAEVGIDMDGATWVKVPLVEINPLFGDLTPSRVRSALERGVKDCDALSDDAVLVLSLLTEVDLTAPGVRLRGTFWGGLDDDGRIIVSRDAVRPTDVVDVPEASVLALAGAAHRDSVVAELNRAVESL